MYPSAVGTALFLVLFYHGPVAWSAEGLPAHHKPGHAYSDGGPVDLDDFEEQIVERLAQSDSLKQPAGGSSQGEGADDLEIDLEPAAAQSNLDETKEMEEAPAPVSATKEEAPVPAPKSDRQAGPSNPEKKGQMEFITFTDPDLVSARKADIPVVEAKRAPEGGNLFHDPDAKGPVTRDLSDTMFVAVTTVCSAAAVFGLVAAGFCWFRVHKQHQAAREAAYPQYGGTGPAIEKKGKKSPTAAGDASLAYSAQLHHFNQTKQKILSSEQPTFENRGQESDDSDAEGEEGDYSVYECPGLAPTGDIEVSNPMFENASPKSKEVTRED